MSAILACRRAFASPVTDGKRVWWKNGMGAVACFDMEGKQLWSKRTGGGSDAQRSS